MALADGVYGAAPSPTPMAFQERATEHLEAAGEAADAWMHIGIAGIYAMLHLADTVQHGLRDIIYELRS